MRKHRKFSTSDEKRDRRRKGAYLGGLWEMQRVVFFVDSQRLSEGLSNSEFDFDTASCLLQYTIN